MAKILFLTTAHNYDDDRIFYHQAKELKSQGHEVMVSSLCSDFQGVIEGVLIQSFGILTLSSKEKTEKFRNICTSFSPDCIICSEPLAVIATKEYTKYRKAPVLYDITEWYPSKRMLKNYFFFGKLFHFIKFGLIQLYAGFISSAFIFGEHTKKFPLAYLFPRKLKLVLPYFPSEIYIQKNIKKLKANEITLCYTGEISKEKGIDNFFNASRALRKKRPLLQIKILIIGGARSEGEQFHFENLVKMYKWANVSIQKPTPFAKFTESFSEADICFDLRTSNIENNHCLPIKIFYYAAAGKPVIYTDLKATREFVNVSKFGYLVNPENSNLIADYIIQYIENTDLYDKHAVAARKEYEGKYNWEIIRRSFTDFVTLFIHKD
ncbi:glycosyltransferase [Chryseobacterium salivictor]|uniref:Glycosyl transferase family 1 domain-containing protein n=1 Tax=Chryseobacterium salivictor TaxID=2547600 RepID=A0A4P6ZDI0_9FLAO|nr:glycosyltransferase [Chryseobacterium salivictor]QBO57583.1 hypothetical protein NBC122_00748 [Chryseobacterium salivictor]